MKNKSEVLLEYRKSLNKPEKYQALRLEIEVDKRDRLNNVWVVLHCIRNILTDLREEYGEEKRFKESAKCVKEIK